MYLKKLRISGFKSFADPIDLEFSKGISAIVGPNGSGKSNITDAIKWVLGEQSIKSLRGKKMEDVIFSGTDKKPPSGYAEVVLILDNTDETISEFPREIAISRKLYRSGESEYAINKKHCRLKEVQSLFMDTGLGKNGYSLISQGGIESIISSTPSELRRIFEEAVGIVSYKTKKNEAEKKLDQTQGHIDRLKDIMLEIEKQLGPLKRQSQKAKVYQEVRDELKIVDLVIFHNEIKVVADSLQKTKKKFEEQNQKCSQNENSITEVDQVYQTLTIENRKCSIEMKDNQNVLWELQNHQDRIQKEVIRGNSQLEANKININRLSGEEEILNGDINRIKEELSRNEELIQEKNQVVVELTSEKVELEEVINLLLDNEQLEKKSIQQLQQKVIDTQKSEEELVENRIKLKTRIQDFSGQIKFLEETRKNFEEEVLVYSGELNKNQPEIEKISGEIEEKEKSLDILKEQKQEKRSRGDACTDAIQVLSNNIKVNESKIDYLKNIQKNYQDYFPTIRQLMTSEKLLGSAINEVYGPIGELIETDPKYLQAIEIALGAKSQNIVVSTISIARQCIDLLKKQRLGRATFLPLDNLRISGNDEKIKDQVRAMDGVEGFAADLIKTDEKFTRCVDSLLGRTVVVISFDAAKRLQKGQAGRYTIVTLEGEIFYPGGAIVGGQNRESKQSPMSKKIEIANLEKETKIQQEKLTAAKKFGQQLDESLKNLEPQLLETEAELKILNQSKWEISRSLENFKKQLDERSRKLKQIDADKETIKRQKENILEELAQIEKAYENSKKLSREPISEFQLDSLRTEIEEKKALFNQLQMKLTEKKGEIKALENEKRLFTQQLEQQRLRVKQIQNEKEKCLVENQLLVKQLKKFELQEQSINKDIEALQEKIKLNQEIFSKNSEQLTKLQDQIKEVNHILILNNDEKNKLLTEINGLEIKSNHLEETIQKNYEMNAIMVEDAVARFKETEVLVGLDLSEQRQRQLKAKINSLGNINLNAIEEYKEIQIRYDFMKEQLQDLDLAKKELLDIISDLYEAMTQQFKSNFIKLQEAFSRIFMILFEGGRAYLEFTDPTGVLEGGIELVAQPPGKRLRHISLLSGGEKSMVAIALLFSFLEINPAPFCVIDEIDAALDDHNIFRYINYLKNLSEENQFITITHRRKTLEVCDDLYGVSMSKEGVSQLVSVRLTDYV